MRISINTSVNTTKNAKKTSILKYIRIMSVIVGFSIAIGSYDAAAKLPLNAFKGVTNCFQEGKKYSTPTIGMAALDGSIIENIRFYGNFTPAYKKDPNTGLVTDERDYAKDYSDDPVWRMDRIFFPSTAGHLSAESSHIFNFGKYVMKPETVALILNYVNEVRNGQQNKLKGLEEKIKGSILTPELLNSSDIQKYNQSIELQKSKMIEQGENIAVLWSQFIDSITMPQNTNLSLDKDLKEMFSNLKTPNELVTSIKNAKEAVLTSENSLGSDQDSLLGEIKKAMLEAIDVYFRKNPGAGENKFLIFLMKYTINNIEIDKINDDDQIHSGLSSALDREINNIKTGTLIQDIEKVINITFNNKKNSQEELLKNAKFAIIKAVNGYFTVTEMKNLAKNLRMKPLSPS